MPASLILGRAGAALAVTAAAISLMLNCGGSSSAEFGDTPAGREKGPCRAGNQCDPGLVCLSGLCVSNGSVGSGGSASTGGSSASGGMESAGGSSAGGGSTAGGSPSTGGGPSGEAGSGEQDGGAGSPSVECEGAHPNVLEDPPRRECDPGACYCSDPFDTCFPSEMVAQCCQGMVICATDGGSPGVDCSGTHPIVGPPRTCEPGHCLCSEQNVIDVCLPQETAVYCCPPDVALDCVPE